MTDGFLISQYLGMIWAKEKIMCVERMIDCHSTKMQLIPLPTNPELLRGSETPVTRVQWDHTNCRHGRHFLGIKATHLQTIFLLAVSSQSWTFPYPQLTHAALIQEPWQGMAKRHSQEVYQYSHFVSQAGASPHVGDHNQNLFLSPFPIVNILNCCCCWAWLRW